jgi:Bacteriophage HK97-gp10, putative tail-component
MPFITVKVTGLNEAIAFSDNVTNRIPQTRKAVLEEAGDFFVKDAQKNVHVITGRLRSSIGKGQVQQNSITVGATAPYAAFENRRPGQKGGQGEHNFGTRAAQATVQVLPNIVKRGYDELLKP